MQHIKMRAALLLLSVTVVEGSSSCPATFSSNACSLFETSMSYLEYFWDPVAGYLFDETDQGPASAMRHETRTSTWYAVGLLARNQGDDVANAERVFKNVVSGQFTDPSQQWYGTYQKEPEEPLVGTAVYPAEIYDTWDPNWRGFIGTSLIIALEEYSHLLSREVQDLLLQSLYHNAVGDSYRVGGVGGDNLYPCYSNPSIMRAVVSGWTGRRLNDTNMTAAGEMYGREIVKLFNMTDTLSEFNSATYTGVSLYGLTLWDKYMPADSVLKQNAAHMISATWESVAQLWHPGMRNLAGPWDRTYGWDMNRYFGILAAWIWLVIGREGSSVYYNVAVMSHHSDFAFGPLFAILADSLVALVPDHVQKALKTFQGEHTYHAQAYSPPFDFALRNYTSWISEKLTIGAISFDEDVLGGPSTNLNSWSPAVAQWYQGNGNNIGYLVHHATESTIDAEVTPGSLKLTYPYGNSSSIFTFLLSSPTPNGTLLDWNDADGLDVKITTYPEMTLNLTFAGAFGGASETIHDFEFYNFTYTLPKNFTGQPWVQLEMTTE
ncbi:hypothetical protein KC334_g4855 [Hortaea werneckii]|nr:hypothetical protein KC334_g4855 [Hortaea werneckii]